MFFFFFFCSFIYCNERESIKHRAFAIGIQIPHSNQILYKYIVVILSCFVVYHLHLVQRLSPKRHRYRHKRHQLSSVFYFLFLGGFGAVVVAIAVVVVIFCCC